MKLKKLKKELAKKAVKYIELHEGNNNQLRREALKEIHVLRSNIAGIEALGGYGNEINERNHIDSMIHQACDSVDYNKSKGLIKDILLCDAVSIIELLKRGCNLQNAVDAVKLMKRNADILNISVIGQINLIDSIRPIYEVIK